MKNAEWKGLWVVVTAANLMTLVSVALDEPVLAAFATVPVFAACWYAWRVIAR